MGVDDAILGQMPQPQMERHIRRFQILNQSLIGFDQNILHDVRRIDAAGQNGVESQVNRAAEWLAELTQQIIDRAGFALPSSVEEFIGIFAGRPHTPNCSPRLPWKSPPISRNRTRMPWIPPHDCTGLIFDCDGTLADTMPLHFIAWTRLFNRLGVPFPEERFYAMGGIPTARIIQTVCADFGVDPGEDVTPLVAEKEAAFLESIELVRPIEAVVAIYHQYSGAYPIAVASGGYRDVVLRTLAAIGLTEFDAVVCAEETARHKPEPDVFLEAARRLGVDPQGCVVFEDTDIGLEAAHRAGMRSVDVRGW